MRKLIFSLFLSALSIVGCANYEIEKPAPTQNQTDMQEYLRGYNAAKQEYEAENSRLRQELKTLKDANKKLEKEILELRAENYNLHVELKSRQDNK